MSQINGASFRVLSHSLSHFNNDRLSLKKRCLPDISVVLEITSFLDRLNSWASDFSDGTASDSKAQACFLIKSCMSKGGCMLDLSQLNLHSLPPLDGLRRLEKINLSNNHICELGADFFSLSQLKEIDLSGNCLNESSCLDFTSFKFLKSLNLSVNQIDCLDKFSVKGCSELEELFLFDNAIFDVSNLDLTECTKLVRLNLSSNKIQLFDCKLPNPCFLWSLDLSCNEISTFLDSDLYLCTQLMRLSLGHNQLVDLKGLPKFDAFSNLVMLQLSYNFLKSIDEKDWVSLRFLSFLDLSFNQLTDFSKLVFHQSSALHSSDLSRNLAKYLLGSDVSGCLNLVACDLF